MPPEEKTAGEQRLCRRFLESSYYRNCRQLFCFVALPQEPETRGILRQALADGKIVAVPRCLPERRMAFPQLNGEGPLEQQLLSGSFGVVLSVPVTVVLATALYTLRRQPAQAVPASASAPL